MFDVKEILTAGMVLFAVIDIIGSTPIIIGLRQKVGHIQSEKASLVAMIIMIGFLFVGEEILNLIGIDVNSFAVANIIVAIVVNILVVYVVLKSSKRIERFLGNSGISVIRKVFGVILLAIAVKLFASNVQELF